MDTVPQTIAVMRLIDDLRMLTVSLGNSKRYETEYSAWSYQNPSHGSLQMSLPPAPATQSNATRITVSNSRQLTKDHDKC